MQRSYAPRNGAPPPKVPRLKQRITIRVDPDLIDWFKWESRRTGGRIKYQTAINDALKWYVAARYDAGTTE
jgi:uncharacterized protein (DUF4415 family)